jgi:integrase
MARPRLSRPSFKLARRGKLWSIEYWWEGRSWRVPTGKEDEGEAKRELAQFEAGWDTPTPPDCPTLGAILDAYEKDRTRPREEGGVASPQGIQFAVKALKRHLADLEPDHLSREQSRAYVRKRRAEGYEVGPAEARRTKPVSDGTILKELNTLRAALNWAVGAKWLTSAPQVEGIAAPPARDRWLRRGEAARLVNQSQEFHVRLFILLALHTAARRGAILSLTWEQVDLERRRIDLGQGSGRKGRARAVPISEELHAVLTTARELATSDFVVEFAGQQVGSVKTGFRAACLRAGLKDVTPHTLRHTAATWMCQAGVPLWEVAGFLGHKDMTMMERVYGHHCPDHLRKASGAIGQIAANAAEPTRAPRKRRPKSA